jgi:hypothetical protein
VTAPEDEGARLHKRRRTSNYETLPNDLLENSDLSYKARGILCSLLAKPVDWRVRSDAIVRGGKEGREAVKSGVDELIYAGYYRRVKIRLGGVGGRWITEVHISDTPVPEWIEERRRNPTGTPVEERPDRRASASPSDGNPSVGNPAAGLPDAVEVGLGRDLPQLGSPGRRAARLGERQGLASDAPGA